MRSPRVLVAVRQFLRRGRGSYIGNDRRQTNNNQKLTKGGFRRGGLNFAPLPTPPKKTHLPLGLGGGGGRIRSGAERKGRGRGMMTTTTMARGGSKGKVLMIVFQSISEC